MDQDEKDSLMRMTDKLFDKYDVDKSNSLEFNECKKVFNDIFRKMGSPEIADDQKFKLIF